MKKSFTMNRNRFFILKINFTYNFRSSLIFARTFVLKIKLKTMKTKSVVFALMLAFVSVAAIAADPVGPKVVIINQKESGIFKVIYEGAQTGKVSLKIFNESGKVVFAETINRIDGFIRPVNFSGMEAGEYTIEISDASGKQINKLEYKMDTKVNTSRVAKIDN